MTVERPGRSISLTDALDRAWAVMADEYGLLPDLAIDAVLARFERGEVAEATPRMLQLLVGQELSVETAAGVTIRLGDRPWTTKQLVVIQDVLDAWWAEVLMLEPGEHTEPFTPEVVLGVLAGFDAPMVRWFEPWIAEMDGPGAVHLASIVVADRDGLTEAAWVNKQDQAEQISGGPGPRRLSRACAGWSHPCRRRVVERDPRPTDLMGPSHAPNRRGL